MNLEPNHENEHLRFPIGQFIAPEKIENTHIENWIGDIAALPSQLYEVTFNVSVGDLEKTYRPGGWNLRQVIHHLADSHMNAYTRFKLAITEDQPSIKPYDEGLWANLSDSLTGPIQPSLVLLEGLHDRWVRFLKTLDEQQLKRTFFHPEHKKHFDLDVNIGIYAWHGKHHLEHIKLCKKG